MARKVNYECVKAITKELRKRFKGIQSNSYGYCCTRDYDKYHKHVNDGDYVCAKIYKGGINNQYYDGEFELDDRIYFMWELKNFDKDAVFGVMEEVASEWGHVIFRPKKPSKCIELWVEEESK